MRAVKLSSTKCHMINVLCSIRKTGLHGWADWTLNIRCYSKVSIQEHCQGHGLEYTNNGGGDGIEVVVDRNVNSFFKRSRELMQGVA